MNRPTSGSVTVDGSELYKMKNDALTIFRRRKIGFIFQNHNLVPVLNVYENIVLPVQLNGGVPDEKYIREIVTTPGLETKLNNLPNNLFGGQRQRAAIAGALAAKPAIVLVGEPAEETVEVPAAVNVKACSYEATQNYITAKALVTYIETENACYVYTITGLEDEYNENIAVQRDAVPAFKEL